MGKHKAEVTSVEETTLRAIQFLGGCADAAGIQATYNEMGGYRSGGGVSYTLQNLIAMGYVTVEKIKSPPEQGGHRKRWYRLTEKAVAFLIEAA